MADQPVTPNVLIAAALIQSGQFKLADFDVIRPDDDWRTMPALVALRKLSDVICRALAESIDAPDPDIMGQLTGITERPPASEIERY